MRVEAEAHSLTQSSCPPSYSSTPPPILSNPLSHPSPLTFETSRPVPRFDYYTDPMEALSDAKRRSGADRPENLSSPIRSPSPVPHPSYQPNGMANCYVFKSRLQEYAQKVGISTPEYQTVKEGPSHEPVFKSTVIVNDVKYDSLPGFFNRKAAEQSAAEVALMEIHKLGQMKECIPTVHETGLCKNLLQEYAQKMNYAIPSYVCIKQPTPAVTQFTCTVEIGGIQYIGAGARTKKEAEIKAARTALLAIQGGSDTSTHGISQYTVVPGKKKGKESETQPLVVQQQLKPKKANFKRKWSKKKRFPRKKDEMAVKSNRDEQGGTEMLEENKDSRINDEPLNQVNELKPSALETNGCLQGAHQVESTTVRAESFEESREGRVMHSAFTQEEVGKPVTVSEIPGVVQGE